MRIGILPESIYERSVLRIVHKYNKDLLNIQKNSEGTGCKSVCTFLRSKSICKVGFDLSDLDYLWHKEIEIHIAQLMLRGIAIEKGLLNSVAIDIILPETFTEELLRKMITAITQVVANDSLFIEDINIRTSASLKNAMVEFTAIEFSEICELQASVRNDSVKGHPGDEIIMYGEAGKAAGEYLALINEEKLMKRYNREYVRKMICSQKPRNDYREICKIASRKEIRTFASGEGGIFASLWNLGKELGSGLQVNLKKIPINQETIEVCDFLDVNPYMSYSSGCLLFVAPIGTMENVKKMVSNECMDRLKLIGNLTADNDRKIILSEESRFLTPPEQDMTCNLWN